MDETLAPTPAHCMLAENSVTKEGILSYKTSTNYLGKEHWKACFVVLR